MKHSSRRRSFPRSPRRERCLSFEGLETRRLLAPLIMTDDEQLVVELLNRARQDPVAEATRLGIGLNEGLPAGTISTAPKSPLAPHQALHAAAVAHSQDMIDRNFFDHENPDGQDPGDRIRAAGYAPNWSGENLAFDYSPTSAHDSLFYSPGHRENILRPEFREVGVGIRPDGFGLMVTEKFGRRASSGPILTGVAFDDARVADQFFTPGEGLANLTITAQSSDGTGPAYQTTTGPTGAYALPLPSGVYHVSATGGSLASPIRQQSIAIQGANVKVDFVPPDASTPADAWEPNDAFDTATDADGVDVQFAGTLHSASDVDYFHWTAQAAGPAQLVVAFPADAPQLQVSLYDQNQQLVRNASGASPLTLNWSPASNDAFYVHVTSLNGEEVDAYSLDIQGVDIPVGVTDRASTEVDQPIGLSVLANDLANDSVLDATSARIQTDPTHGSVTYDSASAQVRYVPDVGFLGRDTFFYQASDQYGNELKPTRVQIAVVSPGHLPWQNMANPLDVTGEREVTAFDIAVLSSDLLVNQVRILDPAGQLGAPKYIDTNGDNQATPQDISLLTSHLVREAGAGAEGEFAGGSRPTDSTSWQYFPTPRPVGSQRDWDAGLLAWLREAGG